MKSTITGIFAGMGLIFGLSLSAANANANPIPEILQAKLTMLLRETVAH